MVFSNVLFLFVFLPAVIAAYFIVPSKFVFLRNLVLLGFSLIFYFLGGHQYITLILASILMNFLFGLVLENRKNKLLVGLFVGANLLAIGVFKYMGLILSTMKAFGINVPDVSVELPIGISFFTFQAISYLVDVYRSDAAAQKNPFNFGLYISMFPQLIAGPIVRYQEVAKEMKERKIRIEDFGKGVERLVFGFAKKILIANQMGLVADQVFNRASPVSASLAWLGAIAYGFQIYFDFSGYSDMAIGLGKIFGYNFPENFNHPYTCSSITDFWRKWHMTLSTWFRDYVYIPLGGSRTGKARHAFNLMAVWLLTGLWHGANWTFAVWGAYFGALLIGEKFVIRPERLGKVSGMAYRILCLALIAVGWVIFRSPSLHSTASYLRSMFGANGFQSNEAYYIFAEYKIEWIAAVLASTPIWKHCENALNGIMGRFFKTALMSAAFALSVIFLLSGSFNPFIYYQF